MPLRRKDRRTVLSAIQVLLLVGYLALLFFSSKNIRALASIVPMLPLSAIITYCTLRVLPARLRDDNNDKAQVVTVTPRAVIVVGLALATVSVVAAGALLYSLFALGLQAWVQAHKSDQWSVGFIVGLVGGTLLSWLGAFQVRLSEDTLEYVSLFGGYRSLRRDEIRQASIEVGPKRPGGGTRLPPIRLEVKPNNIELKTIYINWKVLSRRGQSQLVEWLGELFK
jgi:hypothetical protein